MTATDEFPEPVAGKPVWLMTLADLALLLVGFLVFVQASRDGDAAALARGIRQGFGAPAAAASAPRAPDAMPVAAAAMLDFAPGSAQLPSTPAAIAAWAGEVTRDPRVTLKIAGAVDGSARDVDPVTGSGAILATDRARAVAAALVTAHAVPPGRFAITAADRPGRRAVVVTVAYDAASSPRPLS